jgi:predicted dinucleotide-binding enzyme
MRDFVISEKVSGHVGTYAAAVRFGEVILLTTIWKETEAAISVSGDFKNKILIDATNPELPDGRGLVLGHETSGAELVAQWAPGARVVKAFNHIYAQLLNSHTEFKLETATIFYCGDNENAKNVVASLIDESGFEPIDAGPLQSARYLEPLAALLVQLVAHHKWSPNSVAFRLLHD